MPSVSFVPFPEPCLASCLVCAFPPQSNTRPKSYKCLFPTLCPPFPPVYSVPSFLQSNTMPQMVRAMRAILGFDILRPRAQSALGEPRRGPPVALAAAPLTSPSWEGTPQASLLTPQKGCELVLLEQREGQGQGVGEGWEEGRWDWRAWRRSAVRAEEREGRRMSGWRWATGLLWRMRLTPWRWVARFLFALPCVRPALWCPAMCCPSLRSPVELRAARHCKSFALSSFRLCFMQEARLAVEQMVLPCAAPWRLLPRSPRPGPANEASPKVLPRRRARGAHPSCRIRILPSAHPRTAPPHAKAAPPHLEIAPLLRLSPSTERRAGRKEVLGGGVVGALSTGRVSGEGGWRRGGAGPVSGSENSDHLKRRCGSCFEAERSRLGVRLRDGIRVQGVLVHQDPPVRPSQGSRWPLEKTLSTCFRGGRTPMGNLERLLPLLSSWTSRYQTDREWASP